MTEVSLDAYDPFAPEVVANPFPYYERLRRESPVHCVNGYYVLTRYEDVQAAAMDHETFSSTWGPGPIKIVQKIRTILSTDPPAHTAVRSIMAKAFTPRMVRRVEERITGFCEQMVDAMLTRGDVDLVAEYGIPLPTDVIAFLLGVPTSDRAQFKAWSDDIVEEIGARKDASEARKAFSEYFLASIRERAGQPQDDMISRLLEPGPKGDRLSEAEVLAFCQALLVAGNETTTGLISNLFLALAQRPAEWKRLREDPSLVESAVEESLRFDAPNQGLFRHTTRDVTLHGVTIPKETKVLLSFGAAGRDPEKFPDPEQFDVGRSPNRHIAFGAGIHHCLGANLGRLEAQVALRTAVAKIGEIRLRDAAPPYNPVFFIRCPLQIPATLTRG